MRYTTINRNRFRTMGSPPHYLVFCANFVTMTHHSSVASSIKVSIPNNVTSTYKVGALPHISTPLPLVVQVSDTILERCPTSSNELWIPFSLTFPLDISYKLLNSKKAKKSFFNWKLISGFRKTSFTSLKRTCLLDQRRTVSRNKKIKREY